MATNIDKALYQRPTGIEELAQAEPEIEIEIVDPEEVNIGIDGLEISLTPEAQDGRRLLTPTWPSTWTLASLKV
jgi:hypothetical protein